MATSLWHWRQANEEFGASRDLARGGARWVLLRWLIHIQSAYYAVMAAWPLIDIDSFLLVTGPKTDLWLVKTVSWLLLATAVTLETALVAGGSLLTAALLGLCDALALGGVDLYYSSKGTIPPIYRLDAVVEFTFSLLWLVGIGRGRSWGVR